MKKSAILFTFLLLLIVGCSLIQRPRVTPGIFMKPVPEIPHELRGVWVTRFSWAHENPDTMRNNIIDIVQQVANANFNAVFFQLRGQAETLYPSTIETWSKLVGEKDPGFDPVALAVDEAHRHGLTFYAYINLLPLWNEENPPKDTNHLYYKHGPDVSYDSCWVCFGQDGKPMQINEYYYMNPAHPQVKSYLKDVIHHFVENYDVDGLHFDRIRYPGDNFLFDPISVKQFEKDSLQSPLSRGDWARRKLTDLVEDVVAEALLIKPYLHISAATWGLYRTDDLKGYKRFGSGYHNYYQDAIDWLDRGIMDFIVPMIYWDMRNPRPNFHELWKDFRNRTPNYRYIFPGMRIRSEWIIKGEIARQVRNVRQNSGLGHVMFSVTDLRRGNGFEIIKHVLYRNKVELPQNLKRARNDQVVALKLDALSPETTKVENVRVEPFALQKTTDAKGWIGMILPERPDAIKIQTSIDSARLSTNTWRPPYRYIVQEDGSALREQPWVEFRRTPRDTTHQPEFNILCKTDYPAKTFIDGDSVKIYKTGIFFNKLTFEEGANRVRATVIGPDSSSTFYEHEFYFRKMSPREPFPLWIDSASVEPNEDQILQSEDRIRITFRGSKGQKAFARIRPTKMKIPLVREDFSDYSIYTGDVSLHSMKKGKKHKITLMLESTSNEHRGKKLRMPLTATFIVKNKEDFPLVKVKTPQAIMRYNLGQIRLGGPIIAENDTGIILQTSGQVGEKYRIYLSRNETGFIDTNDVQLLPKETIKPFYYMRWMSVLPTDSADIVRIPYLEPVPYAIYPVPDQNQIKISLYGVKTTSTWLTHRRGLKIIKKVTWEQVTPETYQVIINLKTPKIWGYECKPQGSFLVFRIKYPPELKSEDPDLPFKGLELAIEAGHGGENLGAVGLSGIYEKDVNLDVAKKLENICRANGIDVLQVRDRDEYMTLTLKRDTVVKSDADLFVSIHANAGGGRGGYLGVSGTSTYYNNPFWAEFAEIMYKNLLELPLEEFGVVGSFNYKVIRMSSRPTILVEQAFLDHAEDEEKLFSEEFRGQMAQKIYEGVVDYVKYMLVDVTKLSRPTLLDPLDGAIQNSAVIDFAWNIATDDISDVDHFILEYATNNTFVDAISVDVREMFYRTNSLSAGTYWWRVKAVDQNGNESQCSTKRSITIDTQRPIFSGTTIWADTHCEGPYSVTSGVTDVFTGLQSVFLYYRIGEGAWTRLRMKFSDSLYEAQIPEPESVATIDYYLVARDLAKNKATDPPNAPSSFYSFDRLEATEQDKANMIPKAFALEQNLPNPFTLQTVIKYQLPVDSYVSIGIYDFSGILIRTLVQGKKEAGYCTACWDGKNDTGKPVTSGIYFYRIRAGDYTNVRKMLIIR